MSYTSFDFPHTHFYDDDLRELIRIVVETRKVLHDFVSLNTIKYADPIQWNITKQYQANTVVIDPLSGTAYLSTRPVPSGVSLTDTYYWTEIFNLEQIIGNINKNLTIHNDGNSSTSTFDLKTGDWVLWYGILYTAKHDIDIGDAYVIDANIERKSVEELFNMIVNELEAEVQTRADEDVRIELELSDLIASEVQTRADEDGRIELELSDLIASEVTARINADNVINGKIGNLNDLETTDKSNTVAAINEVLTLLSSAGSFTTPEKFGAVGDGIADDTAAIQAAINSGARNVLFANKYLITDTIRIAESQMLIGFYSLICTYEDIVMFDATNRSHWTMQGIQLIKYEDNNSLHMMISGANWTIRNCKFTNDVPADFSNWIGGIDVSAATDGAHDNFCGRIENCHFVRSNITIHNHTDGFLIDNIIWANSGTYSPARYACELVGASWLVSGNQFVGGTSGGLKVEGNQQQVVNNFFDGSHDVLNTGRGLICNSCGAGLIIQGNKFYNQYKNAIALLNCQQALIDGNTFLYNNRSHLAYNEIETNEQTYGNRHLITNNTFLYTQDDIFPYNIVNQFSNDVITFKDNYITGYQSTADASCYVNYKTIISEGNIINGRLWARYSGCVRQCHNNYGIAVPLKMNNATLHQVYIDGVAATLYSLSTSNGICEIVKGDNGNLNKAITVIVSYYN